MRPSPVALNVDGRRAPRIDLDWEAAVRPKSGHMSRMATAAAQSSRSCGSTRSKPETTSSSPSCRQTPEAGRLSSITDRFIETIAFVGAAPTAEPPGTVPAGLSGGCAAHAECRRSTRPALPRFRGAGTRRGSVGRGPRLAGPGDLVRTRPRKRVRRHDRRPGAMWRGSVHGRRERAVGVTGTPGSCGSRWSMTRAPTGRRSSLKAPGRAEQPLRVRAGALSREALRDRVIQRAVHVRGATPEPGTGPLLLRHGP